jgi:hypothetical protein
MDGELFVPPLNFSIVAKGVYRSGYPNKKNHSFLKKLKLKSILYEVLDHAGFFRLNAVTCLFVFVFSLGIYVLKIIAKRIWRL